MVSKARLDLPEPDRPVITVRLSRGISTSMSFRLCSRAPRTRIRPDMLDFPGSGVLESFTLYGIPGRDWNPGAGLVCSPWNSEVRHGGQREQGDPSGQPGQRPGIPQLPEWR